MVAALMTGFLFVMIAGGVPVAFSLAIAGVAGLLAQGGFGLVSGILSATAISTVSSYDLVAIPMFILMAEFVILSGIADNLFKAAAVWAGRIPGGLAIATALSGAGFAAISGSSTAAAATLSATSIPAMIKHGYEAKFACGVVAISGTLAMLIPPSIALILFGIIADVSIGKLLIAGVIPGLLVTLTIVLTVLYLVFRDPSRAPRGNGYSFVDKMRSLRGLWPMIVLFACVTGAIYLGVATPTEASALGACGAFTIAAFAGRMERRKVYAASLNALRSTVMICMIILGAHIFGYFVALTGVTSQVVSAIGAVGMPPWVVITAFVAVLLVLGCFLDGIAILVLTVPVMLPVVKALGYDPIWFGVLTIIVAEVGMITPPVGLNAFVVSKYAQRPLSEVFAGCWPHVLAHLILIALFVAMPQLILWLPSRMS